MEVVTEVAAARKVFQVAQQQFNYVRGFIGPRQEENLQAGRGSMQLYVSCWPG